MEQKKNRQRFWMCYVDGKSYPHYKHYSKQGAMHEAERLAKGVGGDVFVLEASQFVRYNPPVPPPEMEWKDTLCCMK